MRKTNKFTRKIERMRLLENIIRNLEAEMEYQQKYLKENEEELEERLTEEVPDAFGIECNQEAIDEHKMKIGEIEKLITDLEKLG